MQKPLEAPLKNYTEKSSLCAPYCLSLCTVINICYIIPSILIQSYSSIKVYCGLGAYWLL